MELVQDWFLIARVHKLVRLCLLSVDVVEVFLVLMDLVWSISIIGDVHRVYKHRLVHLVLTVLLCFLKHLPIPRVWLLILRFRAHIAANLLLALK